MNGTYTTPFGRLRTASQRRYVLVAQYMPSQGPTRAIVVKRSDSLATILVARRRQSQVRSTPPVILDTHTGEILP